MSLINQMLRDLEKRRQQEGGPGRETSVTVSVPSTPRPRRRLWALPLLMMALLGGGVVGTYYLSEKQPEPRYRINTPHKKSAPVTTPSPPPEVQTRPKDSQTEERQAPPAQKTDVSALAVKAVETPDVAGPDGNEQPAAPLPPQAMTDEHVNRPPAKEEATKVARATSIVRRDSDVASSVIQKAIPQGNESRPLPEVVKPIRRAPSAVAAPFDAHEKNTLPPAKADINDQSAPIVKKEKASVASTPENVPRLAVPRIKERKTGASGEVNLLRFGVVEAVGSVRLMFEFAELPAYRLLQTENLNGLEIVFADTGLLSNLEVPRVRGPLLQRIGLVPQNKSLKVLIDLDQAVQFQSFELPPGPMHGEQLLVELQAASTGHTGVQPDAPLPSAQIRTRLSPEEKAEEFYQQGLELLKNDRNAAAERSFRQGLSQDPAHVALRLALSHLLLSENEVDSAETVLAEGLNATPDDPRLRQGFAELLQQEGQILAAESVLLSDPVPPLKRAPEYHVLLGRLQREAGRLVEAVEIFQQLVQLDPQKALWWLELGRTYEQLGKTEKALAAYRQALDADGLSAGQKQELEAKLSLPGT